LIENEKFNNISYEPLGTHKTNPLCHLFPKFLWVLSQSIMIEHFWLALFFTSWVEKNSNTITISLFLTKISHKIVANILYSLLLFLLFHIIWHFEYYIYEMKNISFLKSMILHVIIKWKFSTNPSNTFLFWNGKNEYHWKYWTTLLFKKNWKW
jgi:hypothetical protein